MSTRIKGKSLTLQIATTNVEIDATSIVLEAEDSDSKVVTFADALAGGSRQWFFTIDAVQSTDTASLWRYLWDNAGQSGVTYTYAPHGNAVASTTQPHFTGTVTLGPKPNIGGGANETFVFTTRLDCDQEPTLATT